MNIKIGKGGSGKINSSKGGSGKTNQRKYIDLLFSNTLQNQLVAFWNLDNASNSNPVASNYGSYSLNLFNGFTSITGKINQGVEFFDYYNEEYEETFYQGLWTNEQLWNLLTNPTSFSVSFWHKIPDNTQPPFTVMGNAFGSMGFHFDYYNFGHGYNGSYDLNWVPGSYGISFRMSGPGGPYKWNAVFANEATPNNTWTLVTATYDLPTTTMKLYLNGVLKSSYSNAVIGSNSQPNWHGFALNGVVVDGGKEYGTNQCFDALGFWSRALDQSEVSSLYNNGNGKQSEDVAGNLTFLFDPIFYKNQIEEANVSNYELDPAYLKQLRDYQIDSAIPNLGLNPTSWQLIIGAAQGTRKAEIKNNTLSYIKYSDNSDVEPEKLNKFYRSISSSQSNYFITPPIDNKKPLLRVSRNDNLAFSFFSFTNSTLNIFVRLQRPIQHKNPNTGYIVREKRGIFCQSNDFFIGYRSPYYNIIGRPSYKNVFNNFSFVFSFGSAGYNGTFGRPVSMNLMTDYKFNFGEMYMLTITDTYGEGRKIYVNGELQTVAFVPFNPLVNPSYDGKYDEVCLSGGTYGDGCYVKGRGQTEYSGPDGNYIWWNGSSWTLNVTSLGPPIGDSAYYSYDLITWEEDIASGPPTGNITSRLENKRLYAARRDEMPLGPGFYKKDGTIYTHTNTIHSVATSNNINYLMFGKSALSNQLHYNFKKRKRYLNNLDIGVINSYNIALSQSQISEMYNNFRYKYI